MSDDDDYVEALAGENAVATTEDDADPPDRFEAQAPGGMEVIHRRTIPRDEKTMRAMKEMAAKFAAEKAAAPPEDEGEFGYHDEPLVAEPPKPAETAATSPPERVAEPKQVVPPAPSLDAEAMRLRQELASEREALHLERAEFDKTRDSTSSIADYERYLDAAPTAYRNWVETMRGEKMSDDDFRKEAADFVTLISKDVLGVKLPDEVMSRIEAQLAKKAVSAFKSTLSRREKAEASKREAEEVQRRWDDAKQTLDTEFGSAQAEDSPPTPVAKRFPNLAVRPSPGAIIVDVIQSALKRDGTRLSWEEASKQADDYLKKLDDAFDKRRRLLSAAPAEKTAVVATNGQQVERSGKPTGSSQVTRPTPPPQVATDSTPIVPRYKPGSTWDREAHRRKTREAFKGVFKPEE